jgi:hypothetical protein
VLRDPEKRARYDVVNQQRRQERWRLVSSGAQSENDFEMEEIIRITVLEALYTQRRWIRRVREFFWRDFERLTGRPRGAPRVHSMVPCAEEICDARRQFTPRSDGRRR